MTTMTQEIDRLDYWHQLIKPEGVDAGKLYATLTTAEFDETLRSKTMPNYIKELCDVIVTARAGQLYSNLSFTSDFYRRLIDLCIDAITEHRIVPAKALKAVNDSNFSKLILPSEVDAAMDHFVTMGVEVRIEPLQGGDYYGAYSTHDQTVNSKLYEANKLLKGPNYSPVDESCHFWL